MITSGQQFQALPATGDDIAVNDLGLPEASAAVQFVKVIDTADGVATNEFRTPIGSANVRLVLELLRALATPISELFCEFETEVLRHLGRMLEIGGGTDSGIEFDQGAAGLCRDETLAALRTLAGVMDDMADDIRTQAALAASEAASHLTVANLVPSFTTGQAPAEREAEQTRRSTARTEATRLTERAGNLRTTATDLEQAASTLRAACNTLDLQFGDLAAAIMTTDNQCSRDMDNLADLMDGYLTRVRQIRDSFNPRTGHLNLDGVRQVMATYFGDHTPPELLTAAIEAQMLLFMGTSGTTPNWDLIEATLNLPYTEWSQADTIVLSFILVEFINTDPPRSDEHLTRFFGAMMRYQGTVNLGPTFYPSEVSAWDFDTEALEALIGALAMQNNHLFDMRSALFDATLEDFGELPDSTVDINALRHDASEALSARQRPIMQAHTLLAFLQNSQETHGAFWGRGSAGPNITVSVEGSEVRVEFANSGTKVFERPTHGLSKLHDARV
ncbi:MAG: hypothetical protein FWG11_08910, partial [Promicromonosporaceae bacterium]|nr:hypothetical protein [Promicromonosporaceae bacterium]